MKTPVFRSLFVTISLILALEFVQLLTGSIYYPIRNQTSSVISTTAFILILAGASTALAGLLARRLAKEDGALEAVIETACMAVLGFFFIPSLMLVFMKNFPTTMRFFWGWGYGVLPVCWAVIAIASNVFFRKGLKRAFGSFTGTLMKPLLVLLAASFCWLVVDLASASYDDKGAAAAKPPIKNSQRAPNVILITFDQLSANFMSLYGYPYETTPFWEELSKESFVFENAHCNICETVPAFVSLFSSKYPWTHGVYRWPQYLKEDAGENLATQLGGNYYTAAIVPSMYQLPDVLGFTGEFDYQEWVDFDFPQYIKGLASFYRSILGKEMAVYSIPILRHDLFRINAYPFVHYDEVFDAANRFLKAPPKRPLFLWTHHWAVHTPHEAPEKYKGAFPGQNNEDHTNYIEYILYSDDSLRSFIKNLKSSGLYDESIIIITSDHGVGFGVKKLSRFLFEPYTRVPLLIHLPGQTVGRRIEVPAEQIDLAPTILELAGKPIPSWTEGESLVPYIKGNKIRGDKPKFTLDYRRPGVSLNLNSLAVFREEYKLIFQLNSGGTLLFNLKEDPGEKKDLSSLLPRLTADLRHHAMEMFKRMPKQN